MSHVGSIQASIGERRQIIVFAQPDADETRLVRGAAQQWHCQLAERDTDLRFVDVSELPASESVTAARSNTNGIHDSSDLPGALARLRGEDRPAFEMVLIGKDGGVKARTSNPEALSEFLALIDTMPMRQAEMRAREGSDDPCQ